MKFNLRNELPAIVIAILPLLYLLLIWNSLPERVPIHWDSSRNINAYGSKTTLFWIPLLLPMLTYGIFLVVPTIDTKKKIATMGQKYTKFKFAITFVMAVLALLIINSAHKQAINYNHIHIITGIIFVVLGNFFPTIQHNYFIGIRLPWTLQNEQNWKRTHRFASKIFMVGGALIILLSLIISSEFIDVLSLAITLIILIITVVYSYKQHLLLKKTSA